MDKKLLNQLTLLVNIIESNQPIYQSGLYIIKLTRS